MQQQPKKTAIPTMQKKDNFARRALVPAVILICLASVPHAEPVIAQQTIAAAGTQLELKIASGSLAAALNQLADEAGLALTYTPDLVAGKTTSGLQGRFTVEQALQRLLEGSGLAHRFYDGNTVTLQRSTKPLGGPLELAPITVSGQLLERSVQDTQTSVVVISGEDLDRSNDTDFYDVVERTPGITALFGEKGFAIRGIDQNGFGQAGSTGLTVNTTVDGASLPTAQSTFFGPYSTWDLDQVEVLRGPQSTQQGRNALAGSVAIRTADPVLNEFEGKVRGDLGQRDSRRVAAAVNVPILEDRLAARFTAERNETDGYIDNATRGTDDHDAREFENFRAKLLIVPTDDFEVILSHNYTEHFGGEDFVQDATFPGRRISLSSIAEREGSEHNITGVHIDYAFSPFWSLVSDTVYYRHDYLRFEGASTTSVLDGDFQDKSLTQEVKFTYEGPGRLRGVLGLFYTDIERSGQTVFTAPGETFNRLLAGLGTIGVATLANETDTENYAVFGEFDYELLDQVTLTIGARYDRETVEFIDTSSLVINPPLVGPLLFDPVRGKATYEAFLPKLGVTYAWTDEFSTGFTVQRGYRAGGSRRNLFTGVLSEFDPEYTINYEISTRYQSADQRTTLNANVFYTDWKDQQVVVQGPSGDSNDLDVENAGSSTVYGLEADWVHSVNDALNVFAGIAIAKTKFDEFDQFSGNKYVGAAEVTASAGASYYFGNDWIVSVDGSYISEREGDNDNDPNVQVPGFTLWNARIGYERDNWAAYLFVRNLFDKDYVTQINDTLNQVRTGEPRFIGVQLNAAF